eukprot:gb/GECG01013033.1/.p1 GENE.gb/GECG01013033.1/~~gb/GECG01013033.1/.p1  ORF type:complete len:587 (+),score=87.14 gb/GECG01013033.1/:1-1761(+)
MEKVARPENELPNPTAKAIKGCTELHLGRQEITHLQGLERFVNLEVLWINDNRIGRLENLGNNTRLKELYAHRNEIYTLKGSLPKLKFLRVLTLGNNRLSSLDTLIATLKKCAYLEELDMHGNPCSEEVNYRYKLIHAFPTLKVLDRHVITDIERYEAQKKFSKPKQDKSMKKSSSTSTMDRSRRLSVQYGVVGKEEETETPVQRMLRRDIKEAQREQKREQLRDVEEMLSQKEERQVLSKSIAEQLPYSALETLVQDDDTIVNKSIRAGMQHRGALPHATRADGMSAMLTMRQGCSERLLDSAQAQSTKSPTLSSDRQTTFSPIRRKGGQASTADVNGLSAWDVYTLKKLFKQADGDKDGNLTVSELQGAFDNAIDYGIALMGNESHEMTDFLFEQCKKYGEPESNTVSIKVLSWFVEPLSKQSEEVQGAIKFKALNEKEAGDQAQVYHHKVQKIHDQLRELADSDPRKQVLQKQVFSSLQTFNRLEDIHERAGGSFDPAKAPPPAPRRRTDIVEFISTVPLREAQKTLREDKKDYKIPPPGQESDSDSDPEDEMRVTGSRKFDDYRKRRKARKPKVVLTDLLRL